jgi:hypothetical protein
MGGLVIFPAPPDWESLKKGKQAEYEHELNKVHALIQSVGDGLKEREYPVKDFFGLSPDEFHKTVKFIRVLLAGTVTLDREERSLGWPRRRDTLTAALDGLARCELEYEELYRQYYEQGGRENWPILWPGAGG